MLGVGGYLIKSYLDARAPASEVSAAEEVPNVVDVLPPSHVQRTDPNAVEDQGTDARQTAGKSGGRPTRGGSTKNAVTSSQPKAGEDKPAGEGRSVRPTAKPVPTGPAKPVKPDKPAEPSKPAEPAEPAEPTEPAEPAGPPGTAPIEPYPPPPSGDMTADGTQEAPGDEVRRVAAQVARVVDRNRVTLARCYERAAKGQGAAEPLAGRIEVQLSVGGAGDAANVRVVSNDTGSDVLAGCLVTLVRGWQFPAHGYRPIDYVWPFVFHPPN
jgi:hypothetical protein